MRLGHPSFHSRSAIGKHIIHDDVGFSSLSTIPLLIVLILLMLAPVFYGFKVWIEMLGAEEIALT